ncbi:MAG: glycosyltransferase family 2 protein [Candidatus Nitrosopolaris sp.]
MSINKAKPYVLVCIPAYNEAGSIADVILGAKRYASEVLVYDDGSSDNTSAIAKSTGATVIHGSANKGYGFAIKSLFHFAKEKDADIIVTLDSDGQHNTDDIPSIVHSIATEGFDIVIGSRFLSDISKGKVPPYRTIGIKTITRFTQRASYVGITDAQSGFRGYSRNAIAKINLFENGMAASTEILLIAKEKNLLVKEVPITVNYGPEYSSTHNAFSHGVGVLVSVIQFISIKHPLLFYGLGGIALLSVAAFYTHWALDLYSDKKYISTNMILLSVGSGLVGVVLLATAVILYTLNVLLRGRIKES